jgi:hypothetical protein
MTNTPLRDFPEADTYEFAVPVATPDKPAFVLHEGERVLTADGHEIGRVKEFTGAHFKVDVRWRKDFWLETGLVTGIDGDTVMLNVVRDDIDQFRQEHPSSGDALLDTEEQMRQRRLMEEQLAAQSALLEKEREIEGPPPVN